jgi:FkbM family methyltransferase
MQASTVPSERPSIAARLRAHMRRREQLAGWRDLAAESLIRIANKFKKLPLRFGTGLQLRPSGFRRGVLVRQHTTDLAAFADVFCKSEYAAATQLLGRSADRILDLGGNVGFSVRLWQHLFPDARVLVIEPDDGNLGQLRRNVMLGPRPGNVEILAGFAGPDAGTAGIDRSGGEYAYRIAETAAEGDQIRIYAVHDLLNRLAGPDGRIDLMKCDIEGAEASVFASCAAWVARINVLVVETHLPYTPNRLLADIGASGMSPEYVNVDVKPDGYAVVTVAFGFGPAARVGGKV